MAKDPKFEFWVRVLGSRFETLLEFWVRVSSFEADLEIKAEFPTINCFRKLWSDTPKP